MKLPGFNLPKFSGLGVGAVSRPAQPAKVQPQPMQVDFNRPVVQGLNSPRGNRLDCIM